MVLINMYLPELLNSSMIYLHEPDKHFRVNFVCFRDSGHGVIMNNP